MRARWALPVATLLAGVLMITGAGSRVGHVVVGGADDPPMQLSGLPPLTPAPNGLVLRPALAPPYCRIVNVMSDHWLGVGVAGCPIPERRAQWAAREQSRSTVQASALAWASQPGNPWIGRQRLVWAISVQSRSYPGGVVVCPIVRGTTPSCWGGLPARLVLVDGMTGRILPSVMPAAPSGGYWLPHT